MPTSMFQRSPASVISPSGTVSRSSAVTWTSWRCAADLVRLFHVGIEDFLGHGDQAGMRHPGAVVSGVHLAQLVLARTFSSALALAAGSFLMGICAAMPPMAWMPRRWQVSMSRVYVGAQEVALHGDHGRGRAARNRGGCEIS